MLQIQKRGVWTVLIIRINEICAQLFMALFVGIVLTAGFCIPVHESLGVLTLTLQ